MTSNKKVYTKPTLLSFENVEEAVAYYTKHNKPENVEAIKRLFAQDQARLLKEVEEQRRVANSR